MVRLETGVNRSFGVNDSEFTFQYGQIRNISIAVCHITVINIYIPVWLDQKPDKLQKYRQDYAEFTFQYGQIRN